MLHSISPQNSSRATWFQRGLVLLAILAVLAFQGWTVRTSLTEWRKTEGDEKDYYNYLSRGFLSRQLSLKADPDPALLSLSDPYDPIKRAGIPVLHDISFYKGRYYLYWGPAPVVMLFLPFRALMGFDLPQVYGNWLFVSVGFLALISLWWRFRRDYFPTSSTSVALLGIFALGFGGMTLSLLRRHSMWELPIASGYACAMVGLACIYSGFHSRAVKRWWVLASIALGLAVASRPTYAFGVAPLMLVLAWWRAKITWQTEKRSLWPAPVWWSEMIALGLPIGLIVLGLLGYNYARFDHPLEFGLKYQMSGAVELTATHFSPRYAAYNAFLYYFAPAQWGRYFPFVQLIDTEGTPPPGYYGMEYTYGLLANEPLIWFVLLIPLALWRRTAGEKTLLSALLSGIAVFYVGVSALLLCFWAATQRYMSDFAPSLILLGCIGLLAFERWLQTRSRPVALIGRWVGCAAAGFTVFFAIVTSFQLHGLFRHFSPKTFDQLATTLNYPSYTLEKWVKFTHGPLEMDLRFPSDRKGKIEPLVSTGWEFFSDQVFVYYVDDHHIRIGFDHVSRGSRMTEPIKIDFSAMHRLRVEMGSLYPPDTHPIFYGKTELERTSLTRWLRIILDGKTVMEGMQPFYDASPESLQIGGTNATQAYGSRFTGQIFEVKRGPYQFLSTSLTRYRTVILRLNFPQGLQDRSEPLLAAGNSTHADTLFVRYLQDGYVHFGYERSGVGSWESGKVAVSLSSPEDLKIYMPALSESNLDSAGSPLSNRLTLLLNDKLVWRAEVSGAVGEPTEIVVGRNLAPSSLFEPNFSGVIESIVRDVEVPKPNQPQVDRVNLRLVFPRGSNGLREPIFVRGVTGAADILLVQYIDDEHIRFGIDHWSVGMIESDLVAIDFGATHDLRLRISEPSPGATGPGKHHMILALNGQVIWSADTTFHPASSETVSIGANHVGASTCTAVFTGSILELSFPEKIDL